MQIKYHEAKKQFKRALDSQKTISIPKLKTLMQSLNMSLEPTENKEIRYLKGEIKKLRNKNKKLERENNSGRSN